MVRLAAEGGSQRSRERKAGEDFRDGEERMARGRRLAARAREKHEVLPAFGGSGERNCRERDIKYSGTRRGKVRPVRIRSERCGADDWWAAVLRSAADRDWSGRSAAGRGAQRRTGLYNTGVRKGHRGNRPGFAGLVRKQLGRGHGLHGDARGRLAERVCPEPYKRNLANALPEFAGETGVGQSERDISRHRGPVGNQQCVSGGAQATAGSLQQQFSALRPQPEHWRRASAGDADGQVDERDLSRQGASIGTDIAHRTVTDKET